MRNSFRAKSKEQRAKTVIFIADLSRNLPVKRYRVKRSMTGWWSLFFVLCSLLSFSLQAKEPAVWGAWGESGAEIDLIRLEGYDRMYRAEIGIDTTMRILDPALRRRFLRAKIPFDEQKFYEVHCRFTVLYLWKDRFVVRFVITPDSTVSAKKLIGRRAVSLFAAKPFAPSKIYSCRCLNEEELLTSDRYDPDSFTPDYRSRLAVPAGDSLKLYRYVHQQILWADSTMRTTDNSAMYYLINPYLMPYSYTDLVEEERTSDDVILNYLYTRLFVNNKTLVKEDDNAGWTHRDGVPVCYLLPVAGERLITPLSGIDVSVVPIAPIEGSSRDAINRAPAYRVTNSFPYTKQKNVRVSYTLFYIPGVLYLSEPMYRYRIVRIED